MCIRDRKTDEYGNRRYQKYLLSDVNAEKLPGKQPDGRRPETEAAAAVFSFFMSAAFFHGCFFLLNIPCYLM